MNLYEALQTALSNERHIRDHYARGAEAINDPKGKKAFETLAKEEQGHVDYLERRLEEHARGKVEFPELGSILPPRWWLEQTLSSMDKTAPKRVADKAELDLLKSALELEQETSKLYKDLVARLSEEDRKMFGRFLDIEDGHVAIVQAELDNLTGLGYWFDVPEFSLEAQ